MEIYNTKDTVKKWYYKLNFSSHMDRDFEQLLNDTDLNAEPTIESYGTNEKDGGKILFVFSFSAKLSRKMLALNRLIWHGNFLSAIFLNSNIRCSPVIRGFLTRHFVNFSPPQAIF